MPHARLAPAHVAQVHHPEVPETLGQIAPRDAGAVAVQHRIHEQSIVFGGGSDMSSPAGKQVLDSAPLAICQGVSATHAPNNEAITDLMTRPNVDNKKPAMQGCMRVLGGSETAWLF